MGHGTLGQGWLALSTFCGFFDSLYNRDMDIMLHTCCGPCFLMPFRELQREGHKTLAYYFNPNIHPYSEYLKRCETAADYCATEGVEFREGGYEIENYFSAVVANPEKPVRCHECYRLRLEKTAEAAVRQGVEAVSTTLLVSPYQDHDDIRSVGEAVALAHGLRFFYRDFRLFYRESVAVSRELGMYRQKYCGCVFSERERMLEKK